MKGRKKREQGGVNEPAEDLKKDKPENRSFTGKNEGPGEEAEEKKRGGRAKKARGGKMVGKVHGEMGKHHAGRKPRKAGGRAGCEANPFTSARKGNKPAGRKEMSGVEGFGET